MATIPAARPGLVFRYRYLRIWQFERGEQVGKERPCCILLPLNPGQILRGNPLHDEKSGLSHVLQHTAREGDVLILLVQSDKPGADQLGLELGIGEKRLIGLPADKPSFVIVSEANIDSWPNADMCMVPGRQSFAYEKALSGPYLSRIAAAFLKVQRAGKLKILVRHP